MAEGSLANASWRCWLSYRIVWRTRMMIKIIIDFIVFSPGMPRWRSRSRRRWCSTPVARTSFRLSRPGAGFTYLRLFLPREAIAVAKAATATVTNEQSKGLPQETLGSWEGHQLRINACVLRICRSMFCTSSADRQTVTVQVPYGLVGRFLTHTRLAVLMLLFC